MSSEPSFARRRSEPAPELLETPALLNRMTSRCVARPSVTAGSQWSIVPVKLVENERCAVRLAEATIGKADVAGLDELRRRGLVGVGCQSRLLWAHPCAPSGR